MAETTSKRLKIMIIEDEEDILTLYNDYLSSKGHWIVNRYLRADKMLGDLQKESPDIYLIDYSLRGNKNGMDVAVEILRKFPSASILFITAYGPLDGQISKNPFLHDKKIRTLLKPVKLAQIEKSLLDLVN